MRRKLAFGWFGGKAHHLNFILPLLPVSHTYVESYGGSGAVLLNRDPAHVEVYNDAYGEVVNFFRILRDHRALLIEQVSLTPFSRAEFKLALKRERGLSDLERARRFFVIARQVRCGLATTATPGKWAYCVTDSTRRMGQTIAKWRGAIEGLDIVAERLSRVYMECQPAVEVILRYDGPDTFFYVDPPYDHESRTDFGTSYLHEMDKAAHEQLADVLHECKGRVALSGYDSALMQELYTDEGWFKFDGPEKCASSTYAKGRTTRREVLWTNYWPEGVERSVAA